MAACGHKIKLTIEAIETAETDNLFIGNGVELCKNVLLDYSGGPDVNAITVLSQESFIWLKYRIKDPSGFRGFQGFVDVITVGSACEFFLSSRTCYQYQLSPFVYLSYSYMANITITYCIPRLIDALSYA